MHSGASVLCDGVLCSKSPWYGKMIRRCGLWMRRMCIPLLFGLLLSKTLAEQFIHSQNNNPVHCQNFQPFVLEGLQYTSDIPTRVVNKAR
jgi:hypothetical protein